MTKSIRERLRTERTPLIDENIATFVWRGKKAPSLVGDFTGWDEGTPALLAKKESGVWVYQLTLPLDAYIEYGFNQGDEHLRDPLNPRRVSNGVGGYNHYFYMTQGKPSPLAKKMDNIPHGTVTEHEIQTEGFIVGKKRTIFLYQPPVEEPVPLMIVWDGRDYFRRAHLNIIVDNLIAQRRIQPIALAMVDHGGLARAVEYACSESTLVFLMTEVLPIAIKNLSLIDINAFPGVYGVMGASMGGLMALYTAARIPQVFGHVLSQSGAFSWAGFDMVVFDLFKHGDLRPLKIWMDIGVYDIPSLFVSNRRIHTMLSQRGYDHEYREYHAGHNYPAWRDDVWRGLEYLYPK